MNVTVSPEDFGNSTIEPGSTTISLAPGEKEWGEVQGLLEFAKTLERNNRVDMLLKGAVFSELKNLYRQYAKALYRAGYRKDQIADYGQFKSESGFSIPSNASISNYTKVYACYVVAYELATLKRYEHVRYFSMIDPLLLAAPFDMLIYLLRENYHNTADRARDILKNVQNMKRSEFWAWLERQPRVTPIEPPAALIDEHMPPDKPYQNTLEDTYESYQLASADFWKEIHKKIAIPPGIKRPLRMTITINELEYGKG